jgi:hypothetical protein
MNIEQVVKKCNADLNEIMQNITDIKGEHFTEALSLHISFGSLVTMISLVRRNPAEPALGKAAESLAIDVAAKAMSTVSRLMDMPEKDLDELLAWSTRIRDIVESNLSLRKDT